jgi:hypothetical protein
MATDTLLDSVVDSPDDNNCDSEDEGHVQYSTRVLTIALIIVVILVLVYYCFSSNTMDSGNNSNTISAQLANAGWILYTRAGCGFCTRQLAELGCASYPNQIHCNVGGTVLSSNCDQAPFTCSQVSGYPFWYNQRTKDVRSGLQPYNSLVSMASA